MTEVVKNHPLYGNISVISEDIGICCHIKTILYGNNTF